MARPHLLLAVLFTALLTALAAVGCDKQASTQADEPAEWVKEANERSREQREARENGEKQLPAPTRPTSEVEEKPALIERPLLWRIDGPNGPVYLFGTIHGGIPNLEWDDFSKEAHDAINASELVVLEADVDNISIEEVGRLSMLPEGKSLKKILGEEHFKTLVAKTSSPAPMLDLLKPWAAYAELSRVMIGQGRPVDAMVKLEARARDKPIEYLETVTEQLQILHDSVNAELVREMLSDLERQEDLLDQMIAAYKKGDVDALAAVAFLPEAVERHPKLYEKLFTARNRAWIAPIERYIKRGDVFVAVGAGHLAGDESVITMLEQKGYDVERVAASPEKDAPEKDAPQEDEQAEEAQEDSASRGEARSDAD